MEQKVCIHFTQPGRGHVFIDGVEIKGVMSLQLEAHAGAIVKVTLTLAPKEVEVTGLADVTQQYARLRA